MAETNLTSLKVALVATVGPFVAGISQAAGIVEKFGSTLKNALLSPLGLVSTALSAGAFVAGVKSAMDRIDALAKSADRLGISTESFAGLSHAAELSGSSMEEMRGGMEKLTRKVEEAAQGNKAAQLSFEKMGTSYKEFVGLAPDQQFKKMADSINALGTQGQKTTATLDVFGKSGGSLTATIALGSKGLNEMTEEAKQLGIAVSRVDAAKIENANDALTKAKEVMQGLFDKIAAKLAPFITAIATSFTDAAKASNGFGETIDNVFRFAIKAAGWLADAWQGLVIVARVLAVGAALTGVAIVEGMNAGVKAISFIGVKVVQLVDLWKAEWHMLRDEFGTIWAALQVPVAYFMQFVGSELATMLQNFSSAVRRLYPDVADGMDAAAGEIASRTGGAVADAKKNLKEWSTSATNSMTETKDAFVNLFSSVEVKGNDTLEALSVKMLQFANGQRDAINTSIESGPNSESFVPLLNNIQTTEQLKAEQRAAEIQAEQDKQNALAGIASDGANNQWVSWADFRSKMHADDNKYWKQLSSGTSGMFDNLSKLQNTHSKAAQKIGKAAAKAKIVTDTASAAMGAYSAMASIPFIGPALGIAAAAAAVLAGGIQLANVDKADSGTMGSGGSAVSASTSVTGAASSRADNGQQLVLHGDSFSAQSLVELYAQAKERGILIEGVRRG